MEVDDLIRHDPHALLGAIDVQAQTLARIERLLERGGAGPRETERLNWGATGVPYADLNLGRNARGFLIVNDGATDAYLALAPPRVNAAGAFLTVPAGTWLAIPLEVGRLCFGGATSTTLGTALVMVLDDAPQFGMGVLTGAAVGALNRMIGSSASGTADDGSAPVKVGGVFHNALPTFLDGQRAELQIDSRGGLYTVLKGPNSTVIANVNNMGDGTSAGTNGLFTYALAGVYNGLLWDRMRGANVFKPIAALAVVAGTPQAVWTPAAGKKFRLLGFVLGLSVAGAIILKDAGTEVARALVPANGSVPAPEMDNGLISAAANNALQVDVSASGNVHGFVFGTEE